MPADIAVKFSQRTHILVFVGTLITGGLLFLLTPKESISTDEKRSLAHFPVWSWQAVAKGEYFKSIDEYVSDNFIFRYSLTEISGYLRSYRGIAHEGIEVFSGNPKEASKSRPQEPTIVPPVVTSDRPVLNQETTPSPQMNRLAAHDGVVSPKASPTVSEERGIATTDVPNTAATSSMSAPDPKVSETEPYQNIESIIVYQGRAVQMVGAPNSSLQALSKVINTYQKELGAKVRVYFMPIPIGSDFYLPQRLKRGNETESRLIQHMFGLLGSEVIKVRTYEKLAERKAEYIYFNTDHHWTGLGAYYAYQAFAEAAQFSAMPLPSFEKGSIRNFLGTLYQRTMSPALKKTGDTVDYYKVPFSTKVKYFQNGKSDGVPGLLYAEFARGGAAYGVFLGGDYPLMQVISPVGSGRKILVIKDSYGNAFVPYLAGHYDEVYVVDYRYYNGSIRSLIKKYEIGEVLFAHNSYVMVAPYTAQRARSFF